MKLTPNRRMAVYAQGVPLPGWIAEKYAELLQIDPTQPYCLSSSEEAVVWERIIAKSEVGKMLLKISSTARLAREAWLLSVQWRLPVVDSMMQSEDSQVFAEWALAYQALCTEAHWVDSATVLDQLILAVEQKKIDLPPELILLGFDALTPQMTLFFEKLKMAGTTVTFDTLVSDPGKICRLSAADPEEELRLAVLKSKLWLDQNPTARIGIVVPDLTEQRGTITRVLSETFSPEFFNIAAPLPLSRQPMIDAAFLVLRFCVGEIPLEKLSRFLRSPFFGQGGTERNISAAVDVIIRGFSETTFTLESAIKKIEYGIKQVPQLSGYSGLVGLRQLSSLRKKIRGKQTALFWCEQFLAILSCVGWAENDFSIMEIEKEAIKAQWEKLLTQYISMDRVLGEHRYSEALSCLQRLAQNIAFAPVTRDKKHSSRAPIQVLGILEALGIPFDYLWVTGLHREAWPLDPAPNPLIPLALQRKYDMPRSSAARELKMARQFTERLTQGGKEVIFSCPTMIEERVVSVSALVEDFPEVTLHDLDLSKPIGFLEKYKKNANTKIDRNNLTELAPAVGITEKIKGGTQVLKLQAQCPFRAFAEIRLQAQPLPTQSLGLNAAERGEIIHQVLDSFWQGLSNKTQLLALSESGLQDRIQVAVEQIFERWQSRYPRTLTPQYLNLEKNRTAELIERFIVLEKTRPYFEVVSQEKTGFINLENLEIKIRIDRVDRLADQSEILVDYKTGDVSISNWFGERPKDPQLPLYCITRDPKPAGIVFGMIRPDGVKYLGLAEEKDCLPGIKTPEKFQSLGCADSFVEQREVWQQSLTNLAREFMQGVARVEPIDGENTCRTCSLKPLCRVYAAPEEVF